MLSCYFNARLGLLVLVGALPSCQKLIHDRPVREYLSLTPEEISLVPRENTQKRFLESAYLEDLYVAGIQEKPCQLLENLGEAYDEDNKFRVISNVNMIKRKDFIDSREDSRRDGDDEATYNTGSENGQPNVSYISGRVDIGANPIFQYALSEEVIPTKEEFLSMVNDEITSSPFKILPLAAFRLALILRILNPYNQRNKIIEKRMHEAFPGIFVENDKTYPLEHTLPMSLLMNGTPTLSTWLPEAEDTDQSSQEKYQNLSKIFINYSKSLPLMPSTWKELQEDFRSNLSASLRSFNTDNAKEQSCATVLLQRHLAQLLTISGYNKFPSLFNRSKNFSYLPRMKSLIDAPEGSHFKLCPSPGSIVKEGKLITLSALDLENFKPEEVHYDLSSFPKLSQSCSLDKAVSYSDKNYFDNFSLRADSLATGTDWAAFLNAMAHFAMALSPANRWWGLDSNTVGYPLANFKSVETAKSSGAVLPLEAHALSLALINIGVATMLEKYAVFLDEQNNIVSSDNPKVMGLRISEQRLTPGEPPPTQIVTTLQAATLVSELAFKGAHAFWRLAEWETEAEKNIESLAKNKKAYERELKEFELFQKGLYGSSSTVKRLTDFSSGSLRDSVEQLKLASSLLLAQFAKKNENSAYSCFQTLILNTATQEEVAEGQCTPKEEQEWKYVMRLIAERYDSPLYKKYSEN